MKLSGETAARQFGRGWDAADRRGKAFMQSSGVVPQSASKAFVDEVKGKTSALEAKWIVDAKAKGLTNPEQIIKDYRAEIAKL